MSMWLAMAVAVLAVLGGTATMLRGALRTLDQRIDAPLASHFDDRIKPQFEAIAARFDQLDARLDQQDLRIGQQGDDLRAHIDRLETKVDHIAEVFDLRLKPLEEDMALIKGHLLGSPAA